jgi:hypothetical protein
VRNQLLWRYFQHSWLAPGAYYLKQHFLIKVAPSWGLLASELLSFDKIKNRRPAGNSHRPHIGSTEY